MTRTAETISAEIEFLREEAYTIANATGARPSRGTWSGPALFGLNEEFNAIKPEYDRLGAEIAALRTELAAL